MHNSSVYGHGPDGDKCYAGEVIAHPSGDGFAALACDARTVGTTSRGKVSKYKTAETAAKRVREMAADWGVLQSAAEWVDQVDDDDDEQENAGDGDETNNDNAGDGDGDETNNDNAGDGDDQ